MYGNARREWGTCTDQNCRPDCGGSGGDAWRAGAIRSAGWTVAGAGHLHEGHRTHPAAFVSELSPPKWRIGADDTDHVRRSQAMGTSHQAAHREARDAALVP